jgi:leucyl aminopeptidase
MHPVFTSAGKTQATPIWFVHTGNLESVRKQFSERERGFIAAAGFEAKAGRLMLLPAADGKLAGALFGIEGPGEGEISALIPAG